MESKLTEKRNIKKNYSLKINCIRVNLNNKPKVNTKQKKKIRSKLKSSLKISKICLFF